MGCVVIIGRVYVLDWCKWFRRISIVLFSFDSDDIAIIQWLMAIPAFKSIFADGCTAISMNRFCHKEKPNQRKENNDERR